MRYSVYQINLSDEQYSDSKIRDLYLDTTFNPTSGSISRAKSLYKKVAEIDAVDFEDVFEIGNIGPEKSIKRFAPMHSVSVGDVIVADGSDFAKFVAPFGFEAVKF
jgi:hypothetical protein